MPLKGDDAKLAALISALQKTGQEGARAAATRAGKEVQKMLRGEKRRSEDPYQQPWQPLKDGGRPLKTIFEGASVDVRDVARGAAVKVTFAKPYAVFHQRGTKFMPKRPLVPEKDSELPPRWRSRILGAATWAIYRYLRESKAGQVPEGGE